ncbi:muconolactone Delta-isomerase family protein [Flexithrix dorotheae]|uniref:muconolactone Delta-isomerase family protein n=1 Tax=Flexithrix dorotheae TaxID=70993 RepID=UPI0003783FD2|nr:muconolactone Delta-isomerase family protein [Flexithrix dorotheae]
MNYYMVDINLHREQSQNFKDLIPKQKSFFHRLMHEGKILDYALSMDKSKIWISFSARSEKEVTDIIAKFPLIDFFDVDVHPLAFQNRMNVLIPKVSLN